MADIFITPASDVEAIQKVEASIQEKEIVSLQDGIYHHYQPSNLQFVIQKSGSNNIHIDIPFSNRLNHIESKYAILCKYNEQEEAWEEIDFHINRINQSFSFITNASGVYGVFLNTYWYSKFTQQLADEYPSWTYIRKSTESTGQQFLNFFGMHIEEVEAWLEWIDKQKHIATADIHVLDWIYIYPTPPISQSETLQFFYQEDGKTTSIPIHETLRSFFYNDMNIGGILDYEDKRFYNKTYYPKLRGIIRNQNNEITEFEAQPIPYHVWNAFDEFGLLLGVRRLHLESNKDYKERILDVFRYPANSSEKGLRHGIARELDLIQRSEELLWNDDDKPFLIENKTGYMIDPRTIQVDNRFLEANEYEILKEGHIKILPMSQRFQHTISFIYGIEMYELYDKKNEELNSLLFYGNGKATEKLIDIVSYINTIAPIMWGYVKWDQGYWDIVSKDLSGLGYIPNMWDTDITKWKDYVLKVNRWEDDHIWT